MTRRPIRERINRSSLKIIGIPNHFLDSTLDDFIPYRGVADVKTFVEEYIHSLDNNIERGRGIMFCGSNGVGKSMLSCIILKEAYIRRYTCCRVTFSTYIDRYTDVWSVKDKSERDSVISDFYGKYKSVELLVLEEVGKEIDSKIAKPILEDLLRFREEKGLPTIICTNCVPKEFSSIYGNSVSSIINGSMTVLSIVAEDQRKK